jgi:hypothetical protein
VNGDLLLTGFLLCSKRLVITHEEKVEDWERRARNTWEWDLLIAWRWGVNTLKGGQVDVSAKRARHSRGAHRSTVKVRYNDMGRA